MLVAQALRYGKSIKEIFNASKIDPWFIGQIKEIVKKENEIKRKGLPKSAHEFQRIKSMGFSGRFAIHPDQIKPIHDAYRPTKTELEWAKGVLEEAKTAGTGAFKYQGKMVDAPVLAVARSILSRED